MVYDYSLNSISIIRSQCDANHLLLIRLREGVYFNHSIYELLHVQVLYIVHTKIQTFAAREFRYITVEYLMSIRCNGPFLKANFKRVHV